ncbi:hypothetical protein FAZ95_11540 [Trinickia violacea]|uniref:Uncharacterized protein n=1 Tax=Trinickia violacea TaxID=2571746 RepID=A0A4P8INY1_9BURK|nr:hypothetical protein FAZ95_11540 [Trinickia violacea]
MSGRPVVANDVTVKLIAQMRRTACPLDARTIQNRRRNKKRPQYVAGVNQTALEGKPSASSCFTRELSAR